MENTSTLKPLVERMSSLGSSLRDGSLSPEIRRELKVLAKEVAFALETPFDTMQRVALMAVVRVAIEVGLLEYLIEAGSSGRTLEDLVAKTGVDEVLLPRLLRGLVTVGLVLRNHQHRWAATPLSQACTIPPLKSGFKFIFIAETVLTLGSFDLAGPVFQNMPKSLAKAKYRCPTALDGPFQDTYDTKLTCFDYIMEPRLADILEDYNRFMQGRRTTSWLEFYPFAENILGGADDQANSVMVVDVGGGLGHGLIEIKKRFPHMKGRLVLQDLPDTVNQAGDGKGAFEPLAHDFFTPQPVKDAKAYLLRTVLHDWPDDECRKILEQLVAAMRPGYSKVLINELVVPEAGDSDSINTLDLIMMGLHGGMERTKNQWRNLLASVGLRIEKIWTLNEETESVIEAFGQGMNSEVFAPPSHPPPILDSDQLTRLARSGSISIDLPNPLTTSVYELSALHHGFFDEPLSSKKSQFPAAEGTELGYYHVANGKEYLTFRHQDLSASAMKLTHAAAKFWASAASLLHRMLRDLSKSIKIPLAAWDPLLDGCLAMPSSRLETTPTLLRLFNYFPNAGSAERHTDTGLLTLCIGTTSGLQVWENPSLLPLSRDGQWTDVGTQPTVLIGKSLQWLSAGRLRAGIHRVVANPEGRQSIVFALRPSLRNPMFDLRPFGEPRVVDMAAIWKEMRGSLFNVNATNIIRTAQKKRLKAKGLMHGVSDESGQSSDEAGKADNEEKDGARQAHG
ncbi:MAG: hypothetical protein Q9181_005681 [Wetmoreana brouardii]